VTSQVSEPFCLWTHNASVVHAVAATGTNSVRQYPTTRSSSGLSRVPLFPTTSREQIWSAPQSLFTLHAPEQYVRFWPLLTWKSRS
jgi:hypothetical protein